jgi:hypothetical protein
MNGKTDITSQRTREKQASNMPGMNEKNIVMLRAGLWTKNLIQGHQKQEMPKANVQNFYYSDFTYYMITIRE